MEYKEIYAQWLENSYFDEATKEELKSIENDEKEIQERFYMDLEQRDFAELSVQVQTA